MNSSERLIIKKDLNSDWVLCRNKDVKHYFYIAKFSSSSFGPMLYLGDVSTNFFKCRSVACAMFDAFISQFKKGRG